MVEYSDTVLSDTFKALGDPTRRALLNRLCHHGPCRVTDLASGHDMSLNAISKHIKLLEAAGLVNRRTVGRTHLIEANLNQIGFARSWMDELRSIWEIRLDRLSELVSHGEPENEQKDQ